MTGRPDVVVVGAGSAGCVVAARLSEDPARSVLLLEAGPEVVDPEPEVAGASFFDALAVPGRTWPSLLATRTEGSAPTVYARGRGTGGSGAVNAMVGLRGLPADYDRWAALGADGWAWRDVAPAFGALRLPLAAAPEASWGPVDRVLVAAARDAGHAWCRDPNVPGALGVGPAPLTWQAGRRVSTADAYLRPARARPNLGVRGDALVDRVLLDRGVAHGVRLADGTEIEAGAVVVCAGAIHTPALLLRSGVDRPGIGQGLKDHPAGKLVLALREPGDPHGLACATLLRWSSGGPVGEEADLQVLPLNHLGPATESAGLGMLMAALMHVHGSGVVRLADGAAGADPAVDPIISFRLLHDERDLARLRAGVRHLIRLCRSPAVSAVAQAVIIDDRGTPIDALGEDDDALDAWLRATAGDYVHAAGTCRMGPPADAGAVVDPHLAVIGVGRLHVADASVFPDLPRANTNLAAVMVGERLVGFLP